MFCLRVYIWQYTLYFYAVSNIFYIYKLFLKYEKYIKHAVDIFLF